MPDFKYNKEDEDRLVDIAKSISVPLIAFSAAFRGGAPTLEFALHTVRESTREYLEELAEWDEDLEILAPGNEVFRRYDEIKDLAAIAVITAEAAIVAEDFGYTLRILKPEELDKAQEAIEEFPSYQELIQQRTEGQMKAYEHLQKIDKSKLSPGFYEKLESKIKVSGITQIPAAVFEIHPRVGNKQYLTFVAQSRMHNNFCIFAKEKSIALDELRYFDPNLGEDETQFHWQFRT